MTLRTDAGAGGALRIAIVGAESTGKTTLAAALAAALAEATGLRTAWVPEALREWCEHKGRTPRAHEQAAIAREQQARIGAAAAPEAGCAVVVCDTTPLMTAVYSRYLFGDDSLLAEAAALHRSCASTLLTATDLPWVADGLQRDGPQVREPVDALLRDAMRRHSIAYAVVGGNGAQRLDAALAACSPLLSAFGLRR